MLKFVLKQLKFYKDGNNSVIIYYYQVTAMKIDRRILKTRTSIKNALLDLAQDKKLEDITVSELTAYAKVNRSTFYLHYDSVTGVLEDIQNEIANKIAANLDDFDINDVYGSTYNILARLSSSLDGIPSLKKCIVFSENSHTIIIKLKQILTEKTMDAVLSEFPNLSESDVKYPLTFVSAGIIESYINWVRTSDTKPMEVLIAEVGKLTVIILEGITKIGIKPTSEHEEIAK